MRRNRIVSRILPAGLVCFALCSGARAADEEFGKIEPGEVPQLKPASDAGQRAIAKMTPDKGLKIELWAAEPLLANPVALNFDDKGRC
ncbi:MAG TPA: hypothetical protein VK797_14240, partial [Tepidisphaeraceae bacterium]|nr:hypothetical protein [Tepidisphaeraceae bacterium]